MYNVVFHKMRVLKNDFARYNLTDDFEADEMGEYYGHRLY